MKTLHYDDMICTDSESRIPTIIPYFQSRLPPTRSHTALTHLPNDLTVSLIEHLQLTPLLRQYRITLIFEAFAIQEGLTPSILRTRKERWEVVER